MAQFNLEFIPNNVFGFHFGGHVFSENMSDDMELVRDYAAGRSEPAFETIVSRYIHLVYSAALRQVRDPHLAEEVTQAVFIILARKAGAFGPKTILPSWLHRTACFAARDALRTDLRRRQREQEAFMQAPSNESSSTSDEVWSQISPMLDAALARLSEKDHQAVVLRFLENKSLSEVGQALGVQEDAARMRVNRALERLRKFFVKHGIVSTTAALGAMISANSVQAAPSALAAATTAAAIAKGAAASGSTVVLVKGALKLMAWAKAQTAVAVGTSVILAAGTVAVAVKDLSRTGASLPVAASSPVDEFLSGSGPSAKWSQAPPALMVRPTHFSQLNGSACREDFPSHGERVKAAGRNAPFDWLMTAAYGFDKTRMIPPKYLPRTNFDYLATLPDCPAKAFQAEIEKEVGFIAHPEMRDVDVLLLKVKTPPLRDCG